MKSYKIPQEVNSELKIAKGLYLYDLLLLIGLIVFRFITINFVNSSLHIWYTLFLGIFGVFMVMRPKSNPEKRMLQAMYYSLIRKKDVYSSINYNESEKE